MDQTESTKPYHHGDLREKLLSGALQLLREEGEEGLSMRKLASRLDVSRTAPYHHFADKESLLCALAEQGFEVFDHSLYDSMICLFDSANSTGQFVERYLQFATRHPQYYDLMFGGRLWRSQSVTESFRQRAHQSFKTYLEQIRQGQHEGIIRKDQDALRLAQLSWATLHGICRFLIDGIYLEGQAQNTLAIQAINMMNKILLTET